MDPAQLSDDQLDDLATKLAPRLPTGTHGDRVILSRRQFIGAATGTLGAGALIALGVDPASAEAAGSQGTADEPNDMYAYDLNVANGVTSSLPMNGNDIKNAGSVSIEDATINVDADDDVEQTLIDFLSDNDDFSDRTKITTEVSTDAKTILTVNNNRGAQSFVLVVGSDGFRGADSVFWELVHFIHGENATVVNAETDNSPSGRSYSASGNELRLAMDSDTYTVRTRGVELGGVLL